MRVTLLTSARLQALLRDAVFAPTDSRLTPLSAPGTGGVGFWGAPLQGILRKKLLMNPNSLENPTGFSPDLLPHRATIIQVFCRQRAIRLIGLFFGADLLQLL